MEHEAETGVVIGFVIAPGSVPHRELHGLLERDDCKVKAVPSALEHAVHNSSIRQGSY